MGQLLVRAPSIAAISLIILCIGAAPARAQNAAAEALFTDGERLLKEGKIAEACDAFQASNRIETRAGTLINLGLCREQNKQLASAWSAFKDALSRVKDPKKRDIAQARVTAIEPRMSYLTISVADESRIEGLVVTRNGQVVDSALWNRAVPIDGGTYSIGGRAPGHEEWSTSVVVPPELGKVSVEVPRFKEITKLVQEPTKPVDVAPAPVVVTTSPGMFTTKRKIAVGIAGVGAAVLVTGVILGTQATGFEEDAYALCPVPSMPCANADQANDLIERGQSRALTANIAYGIGAAAVVGGVVLWFLGAPAESESRVAVTSNGRGLGLAVKF